jgi:SPP1 family predicted phage head-tail adaptor
MAGGLAAAQRDRLSATGAYRHLVTVQAPGPAVPDGDGGFTETWPNADPPTWFVSIGTARVGGEAAAAGTTIATASHLVRGRYRADVTTNTRLTIDGRVFNVIDVRDLDERRRVLELVCAEVVA